MAALHQDGSVQGGLSLLVARFEVGARVEHSGDGGNVS